MESFVRKEQKYLLTQEEYHKLMDAFSDQMEKDPYSPYEIRSVYFDNKEDTVMYRNLAGPAYKQKIRMRSYGQVRDEDPVFLELKKKLKGTTFKKRIQIPYKEAMEFIEKKKAGDSNTYKELERVFQKEKLEPSFYIRYHRKAYVWKDNPDFRLTFDTDLISQSDRADLNHDEGEPLLDEDTVLMELKAPYALPLEMSRFLNREKIYPAHFSKAGASFKAKEGIA